jgi:hypothetical protein
VSYSDDIEVIGALFIEPANHFTIVFGQRAVFRPRRKGLALRQSQNHEDGEKE